MGVRVVIGPAGEAVGVVARTASFEVTVRKGRWFHFHFLPRGFKEGFRTM